MIITNCTGTAQPIPEDNTPLSILPFDYDTFCKEKMSYQAYEDTRDTETFRERLLSDTTELGKVIASQFNSLKATYMVLARNENFTLYYFLLLRDGEREALTNNENFELYFFQRPRDVEGIGRHLILINVLVTVTGSNILSILEQPLNNQGNLTPTFTVMPDLTINIYNARMERMRWGSVTMDAIGFVPVKEEKIATYTINSNGFFSK